MLYYDHWAQSTPVLFLLLERAVAAILGASEVTLRLVPWLAAIAAAFLFADLVRRLFPLPLSLLAVTLFSANYWDVKYAQQVKQYGTDLFASVLCLWLICVACASPRFTFKARLVFGCGVLLCYFSAPSVFWLPSLAVAVAAAPLATFDLRHPVRQLTSRKIRIFTISVLLFGSAVGADWLLFAQPNHLAMVRHSWGASFHAYLGQQSSLPRFVHTVASLIIPRISSWSTGLAWCLAAWIAIGAVLIAIAAWRRDPRGLPLLLAGPVPILAAIAASFLHQYPLLDYPRLLLWALPCCCLLLCFALDSACKWVLRPGLLNPHAPTLGALVFCLLIAGASYGAMAHRGLRGPRNREMFQTLQRSSEPGDCLFVDGNMVEQFSLYRNWLRWNPACVYIGSTERPCCAINIQKRSGPPSARNLLQNVATAIAKLHPRSLRIVLVGGKPGTWSTIPEREIQALPRGLVRVGCPVRQIRYYGSVMLLKTECQTRVWRAQQEQIAKAGHLWMRAEPPSAKARTWARVAMVVSPGKVVSRAPWAQPSLTASSGGSPLSKP